MAGLRPIPLVGQQALALVAVLAVALLTLKYGTDRLRASTSLFKGPHWFKPGQTVEAAELAASRFMRVESHTVRTGTEIVTGWLWIDMADQVNVLVENEDGAYLLLRQTKYGLAESSMAVVGGLVEPNESPDHAARRELLEELGRETDSWLSLGRYRTDANRGGGYVHCFVAQRTRPVPPERRVPSDDLEKQEVLTIPREELVSLVLDGKFAEVKWTATVALAMLRDATLANASSDAVKKKLKHEKPAANTNKINGNEPADGRGRGKQ
jgi:ADP-ribose pyrophosphatase